MIRARSAYYATNVFHYLHVVEALRQVADQVTLASRFEIDPRAVARIQRLGAPRRVLDLLERRAVQRPEGVTRVGIGTGQFLLPLMARVDALHHFSTIRWSLDQQSRKVAQHARGHDIFQFVEGMGHRSLRRGYKGLAVCERRHLHHAVLEGDPGAVGDFPFALRPDPIGDFLEYEYEHAHAICVYSEVARRSFLERGFDPSKVVVTPLGFPPLEVDDLAERRDPHLIAYVGRCDAFKGIDVAVEAVRSLGYPYSLHVAGPASDSVREWLATKPQVTYHGILGRDDLTRLYRRAQALVAPSIESFGYAALEGAGHGARLVCSDLTGAREFLPPDTHRVVTGRDPSTWAEATATALTDESDVDSIRQALSNLSWERSAVATTELWSRLISEHAE